MTLLMTGAAGVLRTLSFFIFHPPKRAGVKEMDVIGPVWHREHCHRKKQEYRSCAEHQKMFNFLHEHQELYLVEITC